MDHILHIASEMVSVGSCCAISTARAKIENCHNDILETRRYYSTTSVDLPQCAQDLGIVSLVSYVSVQDEDASQTLVVLRATHVFIIMNSRADQQLLPAVLLSRLHN